jgi:hypothetical protein
VSRIARPRAAALLSGALAPLLLSGCVGVSSFESELLACEAGDEGAPTNGVVLMAQSVPTASWVPCLNPLPPGWHFTDLDARNGSATFFLDSDRNDMDAQRAMEVELTGSCDTAGASRVPSDREGMRRFERVTQVSPTYIGNRYYVFEGGCITVLFTLSGADRAEPLAVATQIIGTVPREDLQDLVREESDGRLELDPPGSEGS